MNISFKNILNNVSIDSDAIYLLHELMYQPSGNMRLTEMRKIHSSWLNSEPRIVLMHCMQNAFVSLEHEHIQLTELGLSHYLANSNDRYYL